MATRKAAAAHLWLTLIIKELKISVEHSRLVNTKPNQTLNIVFSVGTEVCGF